MAEKRELTPEEIAEEKKWKRKFKGMSPEEKKQAALQEIHQLQKQIKKAEKEAADAKRDVRNHAMILTATHMFSVLFPDQKEIVVGMSDEEIKRWVEDNLERKVKEKQESETKSNVYMASDPFV